VTRWRSTHGSLPLQTNRHSRPIASRWTAKRATSWQPHRHHSTQARRLQARPCPPMSPIWRLRRALPPLQASEPPSSPNGRRQRREARQPWRPSRRSSKTALCTPPKELHDDLAASAPLPATIGRVCAMWDQRAASTRPTGLSTFCCRRRFHGAHAGTPRRTVSLHVNQSTCTYKIPHQRRKWMAREHWTIH